MASTRQIPYHLHIGRAIFASLAVVAVAILYLPSFSPVQQIQTSRTPEAAVLAYATNINIGDLAAGTNYARAQNGLGGLTLNSKLSTSAQLKANDMITKNYWAHVAPDGTQPWYWFGQAGYDYTNAGENLAYGFSTSDATITGWMNSAGHRANILGNYQDVGFGIANGENYQGAQNTVVVAHYATPRVQAPAPAPAPTPPPAAPTTPNPTSPTPTPSPAPTTPAPETVTPAVPEQPKENTPATSIDENVPVDSPLVVVGSKAEVSTPSKSVGMPVWKQILTGTAPAIVLVSATILVVVGIGYVATHISLVKHATILGEQYVLHHPFIDASVAVAASIIVLITTIGHIT